MLALTSLSFGSRFLLSQLGNFTLKTSKFTSVNKVLGSNLICYFRVDLALWYDKLKNLFNNDDNLNVDSFEALLDLIKRKPEN